MNNIKLKKAWAPGNGRKRPAKSLMRVDPKTKKRLIADGIAEAYTPEVHIVTDKKANSKTAEVKKKAVDTAFDDSHKI